jgi:hypothetical protein
MVTRYVNGWRDIQYCSDSRSEPAHLGLIEIVGNRLRIRVDREVLAPSPHTPRTNLARWGEGCKPYVGGLRLTRRPFQHCPLRRGS